MPRDTRMLIYALVDPRTNAPRYVGKSCSGIYRPTRHASLATSERTAKALWVRELTAVGIGYEIRVLELCASRAHLVEAEVRWIIAGRRLGWPLTNAHDEPGAVEISAATREKISAAKRGKPRPDLKGKPRPDIAAINRTRVQSAAEKAKRAASQLGNTRCLGRVVSPETRAKISAGMMGNTNRSGG